MARLDRTVDEHKSPSEAGRDAVPGVVSLFSEATSIAPLALRDGVLELGRGNPQGAFEDDDRISRTHLRIGWDGGDWTVRDVDSRNGTYVNGARSGQARLQQPPLIRIGRSLLLCVPDITPYLEARLRARRSAAADAAEDPVVGVFLSQVFDEIALAARACEGLLIHGETGSGKELAARAFHAAQHPSGGAPFVALNCAAIPEGLAERLLFGAKRGAYSGAVSDSEGYLVAAHRGSLFLDEIAELDAAIQAKLLRVLETREVLALGATRPQRVEIKICAATHKDLREEVSAGRFRQDLYFRIGRPSISVPPLRQRLDEIPAFARRAFAAVDPRLAPATSLIEACALRPWPGNVRELLQELRGAAHRALHAHSPWVGAEHMADDAGLPLVQQGVPTTSVVKGLRDDEIESVLAAQQGNVTRTARALGLHRNQLRRWLAKRSVSG